MGRAGVTTRAQQQQAVTAEAASQLLKRVQSVPNIRDLSEAAPVIVPGRLMRCARPMVASAADVEVLVDKIGIRDLLDLRSSQELAEDGEPNAARAALRARAAANPDPVVTEDGAAAETTASGSDDASNNGNGNGSAAPASELKKRVHRFHALHRGWVTGQVQLPQLGGAPPDGPLLHHQCSMLEKSRFYVALLTRLPWYTSGQSLALALLGFREASRDVLVREVNSRGLALLYMILVDSARPEILAALQLVTASLERKRPVLFFCRAGKDRTGVIAMLLLSVAGASKEAILDDYHKSDSFHKVALAGLEDKRELRGLDRSVFEGAPRPAMAACLEYLEQTHGSVENYLTRIGFGPDRQRRLRQLMSESWD